MKENLKKRARWLSYFTVGYNILEGGISILAGWLAGSIALVGFGLDSPAANPKHSPPTLSPIQCASLSLVTSTPT